MRIILVGLTFLLTVSSLTACRGESEERAHLLGAIYDSCQRMLAEFIPNRPGRWQNMDDARQCRCFIDRALVNETIEEVRETTRRPRMTRRQADVMTACAADEARRVGIPIEDELREDAPPNTVVDADVRR